MAESTLALKKSDYESEVGFYLGYGRGANASETAWTTAQSNAIAAIVKSGLRQFYFPPPLAGVTSSSYDWSFLKPTASFRLIEGVSEVDLPGDFGGFEGMLTATEGESTTPWGLQLTGESQVRQAYARSSTASGRPVMAATVPIKGSTSLTGQRFQLSVWPLPDADYLIQGTYFILPDYLTGTTPYCYGGAAHAETIKESCLAMAEQLLDDSASVHTAKFQERLAASISIDRRFRPQHLGYNGDRSDDRSSLWRGTNYPASVTYMGTQY